MEMVLMTLGANIDKAFYGFDMAVFKFFGSMQNTFLTYVAKFFTTFGDESFIIPIAVLSVVLMLFKKTRKYGFALAFSIVVGTLVTNVVVKPMALRIRPYNTLQGNADYWAWYLGAGALSESDYSFPSGHTTGAFEIATAMFITLRSDNKKKISWLFPALALCVMGSRVYLMVHYATDVLAGMIVGICAGIIGYFLMKLCVMLIEKVKPFTYLDKIDLGKIKFLNWTSGKGGAIVITVAVLAIFVYAFIPSLSEGGEDAVRCAYVGEYDCYNEARVDDKKYPPIDGKEYCKIHWKQLSGVSE